MNTKVRLFEIELLTRLHAVGMNWIARTQDGNLKVFADEPSFTLNGDWSLDSDWARGQASVYYLDFANDCFKITIHSGEKHNILQLLEGEEYGR